MQKRIHKSLRIVFLAAFLFTNHIAFTTYINSSFLSEGCGCGIPEKIVGLLFTTGSLLAIIGLAEMPRMLKVFGSRKSLLSLLILDALLLLGLVLFKVPYIVAPIFALYLMTNTLILFTIDIFTQHFADKKEMGDTRGIFLSIVSLAWIMAPLIAGSLILRNGGFQAIYIIGFVSVLLVILIFLLNFKTFQDPPYTKSSFLQTTYRFWKDKDLRKIFMANFVMQFFYAWMVIYSPIYLSQHIGLPWNQIGIIFAIMLTPFVLFEIPLGILADKKYGEKEIMSLGFIVMAGAVFAFAIITTQTWWVWALVLFATRTGASAVQVMTESYFFKHIRREDTDIIGIFRDTAPLAYVLGPLAATILLSVFGIPIQYLFVLLAFFVVTGLLYSTRINDTK